MITREDFKYLAAGKFVFGKGAVDPKQLECFVEGAVMAWDTLSKLKSTTAVQNDTRKVELSQPDEAILKNI